MSKNAKTLKDINDLLAKIEERYNSLGDSNPFEKSVSSVQDIDKEFDRLNASLDGLDARLENINQSFGDVFSQIQAIAKEINPKAFDASKQLAKGLKGVLSEAQKLRFEEEGINRLSKKQLEKIKERAAQEKSAAIQAAKDLTGYDNLWKDVNGKVATHTKQYEALGDEQKAAIKLIEDQESPLQTIIDKAQKRIEQEERIAKAMGLLPKAVQGLGSALQKIGIPDLGLSEAITQAEADLQKLDNKTKGGVKSFQAMQAVTKRVGENIAKQVTAANLFQLTMVSAIGVFKDLDKDSEALARNMNMSYQESLAYRQELSGAAILSNDLFITSKGLAESSMAINNALGTNVQLNDENLKTFTKLRTTAGLTNEELLGTQKLVIGTNKSLEDATGEILAQAKVTGLNNGVLLNEKDILKSIKDVSAATTLSLGKNPKAIAEAVAQAKALGMNLQQVENIASNILDFESSIQAELEAELLTGKDINLERARLAAMNNDFATVASEITQQIGDAAEFSKMNRLQQDALAKSVGMSREDLAQTLFTQEQLVGLSGEQAEKRQRLLDQRIQEVGLEQAQRELQEQGIEGLENQVGISTQFNAIVEKLKESFVAVGTAVMPIVDALAGMVGYLAESPAILGAIAGAFLGMKAISTFLAIQSMVSAIAEIYKGFAGLGPLGIVGATVGVGALFGAIAAGTAKVKSAGDLMSPAKGKTMVSTKEGGLFELSPNDDVVAAPGAADKMKNGSGGGNGALIAKIDQLIGVNREILQKQYVIEMNGNQVGQEINQSERAIQ